MGQKCPNDLVMKNLFEKLLSMLSDNTDKCLHFSVGYIMVTAFPFHFYALILAVILGIAKEFYDKYSPNHTADWKDAAATILGGILGFLTTIY